MKLYQAYYGKNANGWNVINASKDIPQEMVLFFEKVGSNSTPQMRDGSIDKTFRLFKIAVNEEFFCILQSKYDGMDSFGRTQMLTHGFLTEVDNYIKDPVPYLSIGDDSFRFSADDVTTLSDPIPNDSLVTLPQTDITLLKCVYILLSSQFDYPLYLVGENDNKGIRSIVCSILKSMPFSLRKQISFANTDAWTSSEGKTVIFTSQTPQFEKYFNMETRETNLTSEIEQFDKAIKSYPAYCKFTSLSQSDFMSYCEKLEEKLQLTVSNGNVSVNQICTAHRLVVLDKKTDELSTQELLEYIQDLLTNTPLQNPSVDESIAELLDLCVKSKVNIPLPLLKRADKRFDRTKSDRYKEIFEKTSDSLFRKNGRDYILKFLLYQFNKSESQFEYWLSFANRQNYLTNANEQVFAALTEEISSLDDCKRIADLFKNKNIGENIASKLFIRLKTMTLYEFEKSEFSQYGEILETIRKINRQFPQVDSENVIAQIATDYWRTFDYAKLVFNKETMDALTLIDPLDKNIALLRAVFDSIDCKEAFFEVKHKIQVFSEVNTVPSRERATVYEKLIRFVCSEIETEYTKKDFEFWHQFASAANGTNPISCMVWYALPVVCESNMFEKEADSDYVTANYSLLLNQMREVGDTVEDEIIQTEIRKNIKILEQNKTRNKLRGLFKPFGKKKD